MKHETAAPIGSGGMGEVFKAWDPDLERHIALKYLHHDDPVLVERLMREARAQARVDHPSGGKVSEVGSDDGRPYIAMEFVDGVALDVAATSLTLEQKVVLVKEITEAVQAAHSVGLIHRDLKPANILVADRDGHPHPYVLDFGIARLEEVAGLTNTGQVIGTPGYLSPEQAHGDLKAIDRRTDVFSLGVILYELLGGARPFEGHSSVDVLLHLIEDEAEPLSKKMPDVPRDLETLVMTCLEKDPERRYPSARALADDLGRFLDGEPIAARPIGVRERLVRRARRNPVAASALGAAVIALIALIAVSIGGWFKYTTDLKTERNLALEAQAEAERKQQEATEVTDFLITVFQGSDPEVAKGGAITARELLDNGAERIRSRFEDQPHLQTRLMRTLGNIYRKLALYEEAEELLLQATEVDEAQGEAGQAGLALSLDRLGVVYAVQGMLAEAEPIFERALRIKEQRYGINAIDLVDSLEKLGNTYGLTGRYDEAVSVFQRILEIREKELGPDHESVALTLGNLGIVLARQGRFEEAEAGFRRAVEIRERELGSDSPVVSRALNNLGTAVEEQSRYAEAEEIYRRALAIDEKVWGPDHPTVARVSANLGSVLYRQEQYDEAEFHIRRALEIRKQAFGPNHPDVANSTNTLGNLLSRTGRFGEAESALLEAITIWEQALGPDHPNIAYGSNNLGRLRLEQQRYPEAAAHFERAVEITDANMTFDHPEAVSARDGLVEAYRAMGREDDAAAVANSTE